MLPIVRSSFATRSAEEAMPLLDRFYPELTMSPVKAGAFRFDLDTVDAGLMSTMRYRLTSPSASSMSDASGALTITHLLSGHLQLLDGKNDFDASQPFLAPARRFQGKWDDVLIGGLSLNFKKVEQLGRRLTLTEGTRLEFTSVNPGSAALSQFWKSTLRTLNRDLLRDDEAMRSPLVRQAAFEQLSMAVLSVFPNTLTQLQLPNDGAHAVPVAVRKAIAFIDDHLDAPIMVADIAAAAGLSVRGLTAAFRRELDLTPSTYLRNGRLHAAHRDLQSAQLGSGITVRQVANHWGFSNGARFASAYRNAFGVSPSTTLRY
jgi:AraC-like DNA-binding protein